MVKRNKAMKKEQLIIGICLILLLLGLLFTNRYHYVSVRGCPHIRWDKWTGHLQVYTGERWLALPEERETEEKITYEELSEEEKDKITEEEYLRKYRH